MRKGLTGSTLKIIAMATMLIDHIGAAVLARMLLAAQADPEDIANYAKVAEWTASWSEIYNIYMALRMIGRIAFPIFCFLLVEGFRHTHNPRKYAIRLFLFAAISEIPFDLAFSSKVLEFEHQNVFFTLAIGLVTMIIYKRVEEKEYKKPFVRLVLQIATGLAGACAAELLHTDYGMLGVLVILLFYIMRQNRMHQIVCGMVLFAENMTAWFAFLPILGYNGKRGWNVKWIFYAFYPVHLLILYGISCMMGIGVVAVV